MMQIQLEKNSEKYQLEYLNAQESYNSYLNQKEFVKKQYETLLENYLHQQEVISELYDFGIQELSDYKKLFDSNTISKLDYDAVRVRVENYTINKFNVELNLWIYSFY